MNKTELVKTISNNIEGATQKDVCVVLDTFMDVVKDTLVNGDKIALTGFGTFEVAERAARKGRNPKTGEEIMIPASKAPKFKAGKALKDAVK